MNIFLESFEITGFRSCNHTSFKPNEHLSALIGINGAGKTNLLQGMRLLSINKLNRRRKLAEELSQHPETAILAWFSVNNKKIGLQIQYTITAYDSWSHEEELTISELWNLRDFTKNDSWIEIATFDFDEAKDTYEQVLRYYSRKRNASVTKSQIDDLFKVISEIINNTTLKSSLLLVQKFRASIAYYSATQFTNPAKCPSNFEVDEDRRLSDVFSYSASSTHINFLHSLYRLKKDNPDLYDNYCNFVSRQQLGLISRITWKEIELSSNTAQIRNDGEIKKSRKTKTMVIPKVQIGNAYITFNQLSEGTFKTLALLFHIFTDACQLLIVEEPEVCVHHGLLTRIVDTLKAHATIKQTIISTHSDLLLDDLEPSQVFVVEHNKNGTQVNNLDSWLGRNEKRALHDYLSETGTLGEYWRSGGLSQ